MIFFEKIFGKEKATLNHDKFKWGSGAGSCITIRSMAKRDATRNHNFNVNYGVLQTLWDT